MACSICNGQEPSGVRYDQDSMRKHLVDSFEKGYLDIFPTKPMRKVKATTRHMETIPVYCVCRLLDDGSEMIQCVKCKEWFHTRCVRVPKAVLNSDKELWLLLTIIIAVCVYTYVLIQFFNPFIHIKYV